MGMSGSWPNYSGWLDNTWGSGAAYGRICGYPWNASNLTFGQNPPYFLDNFLAVYPKYFGAGTSLAGFSAAQGTNVLSVSSTAGMGLAAGQFVVIPSFPPGTIITAVSGNSVTVNNNAVAAVSGVSIVVYQAPPIPLAVIQMYLNFAVASLVFQRWQDGWAFAIALFIAHYCTLYARTDAQQVFQTLQTIIHGEPPVGTIPGSTFTLSSAPPNGVLQGFFVNGDFQIPGVDYELDGLTISTTNPVPADAEIYATWPLQQASSTTAVFSAAQIAAQGIAIGIETSKSVGDVSASFQPLEFDENWGAWQLTPYGQQLVTMAAVVGSGPALIW